MKKKIVSILMAITTVSSMGIFSGCNEQPETSVGSSGKNLTEVISEAKEDSTENTTEEIAATTEKAKDISELFNDTETYDITFTAEEILEEAQIILGAHVGIAVLSNLTCSSGTATINSEEVYIYDNLISVDVVGATENKVTLSGTITTYGMDTYEGETVSYPDQAETFIITKTVGTTTDSDDIINYVKNNSMEGYVKPCGVLDDVCENPKWSYSSEENIVTFSGTQIFDDDNKQNIIIEFTVIDDVIAINKFIIDDIEKVEGSIIYSMRLGNIFGSEEPATEPPASSSNSYGIYVTGNTDLAEQAGNTLVDKASFCGYADESYGYVFTYGDISSDGISSTYSNVSVAVNENSQKPNTGTIIVSATRTTNGKNYSLTVTMDWSATDYGDYTNFTWSNIYIEG